MSTKDVTVTMPMEDYQHLMKTIEHLKERDVMNFVVSEPTKEELAKRYMPIHGVINSDSLLMYVKEQSRYESVRIV